MTKTKTKTRARPAPARPVARPAPTRTVTDAFGLRLAGAQRMVLAVVVFLSAAAVWRPLPDPFMAPKITVIVLGAVALLALAGVRGIRGGRLSAPAGPLAWIVAALVVMLLLATLAADNRGQSFFGQQRRYGGALSYLAYLSVLLVSVRLYADVRSRGLVRAFMIALGVVSGYGLLQVAGLDPYSWDTGGLAATFSTMGNTNFAGGYVGMALPLVAAVAVLPGWSRTDRLVALGLLVPAFGYMLATRASQGPIAAGGGLVVVAAAWLLARRRAGLALVPPSGRPRLAAGAAALVGAVGLLALAVRIGPAALNSFSERRYFWRAAVSVVGDHPVLGVGMDSFRDYFTRYRAPEHGVFIGFDGADSVHDLPLGMLMAGGVPLGLAYLAFVGYVGWTLIRALPTAPPDRMPQLAGFGGMWTAYQVQSLVSVDVPSVTFLHFLSAGLVLAAAGPPRTMSWSLPFRAAPRGALLPRGNGPARSLAVGALGAVILLAGLAAWQGTRPIRAELTAGSVGAAPDAVGKAQVFAEAVRLAPWEAEYRLLHARAALEAGLQEDAYREAVTAAELRSGSSKLALGAADFSQKRGDEREAARWVDQALARDPANPLLLEEVAAFIRSSDPERADELVQRAADLRADHSDY